MVSDLHALTLAVELLAQSFRVGCILKFRRCSVKLRRYEVWRRPAVLGLQ